MMNLSVIDNSNVFEGRDGVSAVHESLWMAKAAESAGYLRYWLAEHHNLASTASTAAGVILGRIAAETQRIRVGFGGILMPNHVPLMIAEQAQTLNAFFPGRIDVGLGRTTGADETTSRLIRRRSQTGGEQHVADVSELLQLLNPNSSELAVQAYPKTTDPFSIWLLGSGIFSAKLAARLGLPFAFASHFAPRMLSTAVALYRSNFQPSAYLATPYAMASVNVIAAASSEDARYLATSQEIYYSRMLQGIVKPVPPPTENPQPLNESTSEALGARIIGDSASVGPALVQFAADNHLDELMILPMIHDLQARITSVKITMASTRETVI